jgi:Zn-finger nucleic acid-binding protein
LQARASARILTLHEPLKERSMANAPRGNPPPLNCPRCNLPLKRVDYEGVETDMCEGCWGFFLDTGELETILDRHALRFSKDEKEQVLGLRTASRVGPTAPAPCPKCGKVMERIHFDQEVHLVIDKCPDHGTWLDTGEIKKVQAVAERSAVVHKLLLKKLGLIAQK